MPGDSQVPPIEMAPTETTLREIALHLHPPGASAAGAPTAATPDPSSLTDRWLHGLHRRLARRRLARRQDISSVLFVCVGNLYRSPFAAASFRAALPTAFRGLVRCASAGFTGPDRPCPTDAVEAARRRGVDLGAHRSALLSPARVAGADLIVVMDGEQKRQIRGRFARRGADVLVLGDLDPEPVRTRQIPDPWDQPPEVLEASYDRIQRCARELVRVVFAG